MRMYRPGRCDPNGIKEQVIRELEKRSPFWNRRKGWTKDKIGMAVNLFLLGVPLSSSDPMEPSFQRTFGRTPKGTETMLQKVFSRHPNVADRIAGWRLGNPVRNQTGEEWTAVHYYPWHMAWEQVGLKQGAHRFNCLEIVQGRPATELEERYWALYQEIHSGGFFSSSREEIMASYKRGIIPPKMKRYVDNVVENCPYIRSIHAGEITCLRSR